jgi:hypothetical protein
MFEQTESQKTIAANELMYSNAPEKGRAVIMRF